MPHIELVTRVAAPPVVCFDASLDVDLHVQSTGAREEIVGGVQSGRMTLGEEVTWRAWHFHLPFTMTSRITQYSRPERFVDEQIRGPFSAWVHEHRFEPAEADSTVMTDVVHYESPFGPLGRIADRLVIERYMTKLLETRNDFLRRAAEAST